MKKLTGYRVFRGFTDAQGNVIHKTPIGFSPTLAGARALCISGSGAGIYPMLIEEVYREEQK